MITVASAARKRLSKGSAVFSASEGPRSNAFLDPVAEILAMFAGSARAFSYYKSCFQAFVCELHVISSEQNRVLRNWHSFGKTWPDIGHEGVSSGTNRRFGQLASTAFADGVIHFAGGLFESFSGL